MRNVLVVLGTRPEIIKLFPVIQELERKAIPTEIVYTGQHQELGHKLLKQFAIKNTIHLSIKDWYARYSLACLSKNMLHALDLAMLSVDPDLVIVQGDTTSAFMGALSAYYNKIPVAHVEAGLRTDDLYSPYPEEGNRRMISQIATYHFAPTVLAKKNLVKNGVLGEIHVVGNTGIDTLLKVSSQVNVEPKKQVLVTLHRRESFGEPLQSILAGIDLFLEACPDWTILLPVHPNPNVGDVITKRWKNNQRVSLVEPLDYMDMVRAMKESHFILTDSGGIQEEAPSLNKPVLVARDTTERPEGIDAHVAMLVGTNTHVVAQAMIELVKNEGAYKAMTGKPNPYGDGKASERIVEELLKL